MYSCNKTWHWVERTYKATVISSRLCHSSVVQLYYLLRLWLCVLRLLGSLRTSKTCLRHRRLLKRTTNVQSWKIFTSIKTLLPSHRSLRSFLELAAVCCFCVSGLIHFRHRVMRFTANEVTWYKFPPLSFLLLGTSCLGRPPGDVPCASEDMACGYWFSKVDPGQIRSEEIVYSRFIKIPLG